MHDSFFFLIFKMCLEKCVGNVDDCQKVMPLMGVNDSCKYNRFRFGFGDETSTLSILPRCLLPPVTSTWPLTVWSSFSFRKMWNSTTSWPYFNVRSLRSMGSNVSRKCSIHSFFDTAFSPHSLKSFMPAFIEYWVMIYSDPHKNVFFGVNKVSVDGSSDFI